LQLRSSYAPLDQYIDGGVGSAVYAPLNLNVYAYAYHNPLRYSDPTGKIPVDTISSNIPRRLKHEKAASYRQARQDQTRDRRTKTNRRAREH
jgi:hypothetical protein